MDKGKDKGGKKGGRKGGDKNKGGKGNKGGGVKGQPPFPRHMNDWLNQIQNWGNPRRCKFFNTTAGCQIPNCQFDNLCMLCGGPRSMVTMHAPTEAVPWG